MDTKKWWQSITIDAAAIVFVLNMLKLFGLDVAAAVTESEAIAAAINSAIVLVGTVVAIIGRIRATKKVV